jgi:hypothetical protein
MVLVLNNKSTEKYFKIKSIDSRKGHILQWLIRNGKVKSTKGFTLTDTVICSKLNRKI